MNSIDLLVLLLLVPGGLVGACAGLFSPVLGLRLAASAQASPSRSSSSPWCATS